MTSQPSLWLVMKKPLRNKNKKHILFNKQYNANIPAGMIVLILYLSLVTWQSCPTLLQLIQICSGAPPKN